MSKKKLSTLRLYAKPENGKTLGELEFIWLTEREAIPNGFKRVKKLKKGIHYVEADK